MINGFRWLSILGNSERVGVVRWPRRKWAQCRSRPGFMSCLESSLPLQLMLRALMNRPSNMLLTECCPPSSTDSGAHRTVPVIPLRVPAHRGLSHCPKDMSLPVSKVVRGNISVSNILLGCIANAACDVKQDLAKKSEIISVVQALNQGHNQDGMPCCPIIVTLCCPQQLNDMLFTLQLRQTVALL